MAKKNEGQGFGVFQKGDAGPKQVASTIEEAVHYRFEGWREVEPASAESQPRPPENPEDMGIGPQPTSSEATVA